MAKKVMQRMAKSKKTIVDVSDVGAQDGYYATSHNFEISNELMESSFTAYLEPVSGELNQIKKGRAQWFDGSGSRTYIDLTPEERDLIRIQVHGKGRFSATFMGKNIEHISRIGGSQTPKSAAIAVWQDKNL